MKNLRRVFLFSLATNFLLVALLAFLAVRRPASDAAAQSNVAREERPAAVAPRGWKRSSAPAAHTRSVDEAFHWSQVASADYRVLIANLRAVHCPELTIHDLISGEINEQLEPRLKAVVDEVIGDFWRYMCDAEGLEKVVSRKKKELDAIEDERDELLKELFGDSDPGAEEEKKWNEARGQRRIRARADFLPPDVQDRIVELNAEWQKSLQEIPSKLPAAERRTRSDLARTNYNAALKNLMTAEEYEEWRLREPSVARARSQLLGREVDPETVRAIARARLAATDARGALVRNSPDFAAKTREIDQRANEQIKSLLGDEGHAAYQRAADARYVTAYRLSQRLGLPEETASAVFEAQRNAQKQATELQKNSTVAAEDRIAALQKLRATTSASISSALGEKGFRAFQRADGDWLNTLTNMSR